MDKVSEWDKLWNKNNAPDEDFENNKLYSTAQIYLHTPQHLDSGMRDWLLKVKAVGDELQKHNEFLINEIDNYSLALNTAVEKLEAIQNTINTHPKNGKALELINRINKILGGSG